MKNKKFISSHTCNEWYDDSILLRTTTNQGKKVKPYSNLTGLSPGAGRSRAYRRRSQVYRIRCLPATAINIG